MIHDLGVPQRFKEDWRHGPECSRLSEKLLNQESSDSVPIPLVSLRVDVKDTLTFKESSVRDGLRTTEGKDVDSKKDTEETDQNVRRSRKVRSVLVSRH